MATPNRPRGRGADAEKWPNLFEWAESKAARLGATAQDVCRTSRAIATVAVTILIPLWVTVLLTATRDSQLLRALALATVIAVLTFLSAWTVRALRSRIARKGVTVVLQ